MDTIMISVCVDCAMLLANGEASDEHIAAVEDTWGPGYGLGIGGDESDEHDFSSSSCDGCGSRLGGSRHAAHAWRFEK